MQAEKGGYRHFMLKEIHEQPRAVRDTLLGRIGLDEGEVHLEELGDRHGCACETPSAWCSWPAARAGTPPSWASS